MFDIVNIPSDPDGSFYQGKVYVAIKDAVFEPSSALRYACEHVMVLRANGSINKAIHYNQADGGPEHRVRNGSVKVANICIFCETQCDM